MAELLGWAGVLGYIALLAYGLWLFADIVSEWLAGRIKHD